MNIFVECRDCKKVYAITSTVEQLKEYQAGHKKVQDIYPELSPGDRELLISKTCNDCWNKMFGGFDDED